MKPWSNNSYDTGNQSDAGLLTVVFICIGSNNADTDNQHSLVVLLSNPIFMVKKTIHNATVSKNQTLTFI
jgi:hypothetical protein